MERSGSGILDEFDDPTELVAAGYDRVGQQYAELALLANDTRERYTDSVLERLADGSNVLDLGCGGGRPTTARLARRFKVTGVELSGVQVGYAREAVPSARIVQADMSRLELEASTFDGVVAFYSIINVPRQRQRALFESILSWLRPGGVMVASLATKGSQTWVEDDFLGAPMYWSSFDAETNVRMLGEAGFELESHEIVTQTFDDESESHLWVIARRPG